MLVMNPKELRSVRKLQQLRRLLRNLELKRIVKKELARCQQSETI